MNPSAKYLHFASNVSFFDFPADIPEFKKIKSNSKLDRITEQLQAHKEWDIDSLSTFVTTNPNTFEVIEGLFQLKRFTNAQLTWFSFDVEKLNSMEIDRTYDYVVEELQNDSFCRDLFLEKVRESTNSIATFDDILQDRERFPKETIIGFFKIVVSEYVSVVSEKFDHLAARIANPSLKVSTRFAKYAIDSLKLNQLLEAVDTRKYLTRKLIPTDSKSNHGKFATNRVKRSLDEAGFVELKSELSALGITTTLPRKLDLERMKLDLNGKYYCREKNVEGIQKPREGGLKKFDFIVIVQGEPKHLFEVNFYSTEGTKIGINSDEYVGLNESISREEKFEFHWITDGNFWLTPHGQKLFQTQLDRNMDLYNLNTFYENMGKFVR